MLRSLIVTVLLTASAAAATSTMPSWDCVPFRFHSLDVRAALTVGINTAVNKPDYQPPFGSGESTLFRMCNAGNRTARSLVFGDDWVRTTDYRTCWSLTDAMRDWLDRPGVPTAVYTLVHEMAVNGIRMSSIRGEIISELTDVVAFLEGNIAPERAKLLEEWFQSEKSDRTETSREEEQRKRALRERMPAETDVSLEAYCYVRRLQDRADPRTVAEWRKISRNLLDEISRPTAR